jgi:hypothetical protein
MLKLAMHVESIAKHARLPRKDRSAELAMLESLKSQSQYTDPQAKPLKIRVCLVIRIAMHVPQQMFARRVRRVSRKPLWYVLLAMLGARRAALKVLIAQLAKMDFGLLQEAAYIVRQIVKHAPLSPFALHACTQICT